MTIVVGRFWTPLLLCGLAVIEPAQVRAQSDAGAPAEAERARDGQHDFDFEFGAWTAQLSRLERPLSGSTTWVEYEGTSVVRRVWDGRANLGELEVEGPAGRIQGLTLRLYNPASGQWHISWANSRDGLIGAPMVGGFENGRAEFYGQESFDGRTIYVRFIFSDITSSTFRFEQAFSDDGGKTWEANWIATFARVDVDADGRPIR